jgi:hypothetical protein
MTEGVGEMRGLMRRPSEKEGKGMSKVEFGEGEGGECVCDLCKRIKTKKEYVCPFLKLSFAMSRWRGVFFFFFVVLSQQWDCSFFLLLLSFFFLCIRLRSTFTWHVSSSC